MEPRELGWGGPWEGRPAEELGVYFENAEKPLEGFKQGLRRPDFRLKRLLCERRNRETFRGWHEGARLSGWGQWAWTESLYFDSRVSRTC